MSRRLHYIDWLRVLAVLLLFPFHTSRVFNSGEPFYQKATHLVTWLNPVLGFISTWHMQLLFVLAGASVYFSMRRRNAGQFALERVSRLLVPIVFGIFVLLPPQTWIGGRFNSHYASSFLRYITSGDFLVMNIQDAGDYFGGFGVGHLWFIVFLFVLSFIALPLFAWGRTERGTRALAKFARFMSHPPAWLAAAIVIWILEGLPALAGKNLFYYLGFFVLGYALMFDEAFADSTARHWWWALPVGLVLARWWDSTGWIRDTLPDPSLELFARNIAGMLGTWLAVVGLLGLGKRFLDRPSRTLAYLAEGSYPLYLLHQTVIVVAAFWVVRLDVAWPLQWLIIFAIAILGSFGTYEVVRRIGVLRWLFGMRPTPAAAKAEAVPLT